MNVPRYSRFFTIRVAMVSSLVSAAVILMVVALLDPFGFQQRRADHAAREAVGLMLCVSTDVYRERIAQINATVSRGETLARDERDVLAALSGGLEQLNEAADVLSINCEE